eukprot:1152170-Pelagomonas_calceolata.AAC.4
MQGMGWLPIITSIRIVLGLNLDAVVDILLMSSMEQVHCVSALFVFICACCQGVRSDGGMVEILSMSSIEQKQIVELQNTYSTHTCLHTYTHNNQCPDISPGACALDDAAAPAHGRVLQLLVHASRQAAPLDSGRSRQRLRLCSERCARHEIPSPIFSKAASPGALQSWSRSLRHQVQADLRSTLRCACQADLRCAFTLCACMNLT